jgi:hypothetical protein
MLLYSALRSLCRLVLRALHLFTLLSLLLSWLPAQAATPTASEEDQISPVAANHAGLSLQGSDLLPVTQPLSDALVAPTPVDLIPAPQPITATLETPVELEPTVEKAIAPATAPPAPIRIPVTGGVAEGLGGRVRVTFPAQAADRALNVYIRQPSALPAPSPSGRAFEVIAFDESGQEVESFANPLTLEVRYDEALLTGPEDSLQLRYYDEAMQDWYPIGTQVDTEENVLRARLDHLTVFDTDYVDWEASRLPSLQPFQTAAFTGAATAPCGWWATGAGAAATATTAAR